MNKKNRIKYFLLLLVIIIYIISIVQKEFQNDTFFSIALGEKILESGISSEEKLVWHTGLKFVNPRWFFDLCIAQIYNLFNFCGIYIFVIIISVLQGIIYYTILNKITKKTVLSFIFTIITMYYNQGEFAARGQIISFTLFLIEFFAIEELLKTNKKRYFAILCVIPIILVNTHASVYPMYFLFYLPYIAEFILSKLKLIKNEDSKIIIENKKIVKLLMLLIIGIFAGFCTQKGLGAHTYMFKTISGVPENLIGEMQEVDILSVAYLSIMLFIAIGIVAFTKTKVRVTDCFFIIGFSFIGLQTYRGLFYFYLIASICIVRIINDFLDGYNVKFDFINILIRRIILIIVCLIIVLQSVSMFIEKQSTLYAEYSSYPIDAANYILNNIDMTNMRLYNGFNYGSYLEFKGIPAFMDSRAELYTSEFNEDTTILDDFTAIEYGLENYRVVFEKYQITHALLSNDNLINQYISYDDEWKLIYQDTSFSLYEKID